MACPGKLRQAGDLSTQVNFFFFSRLTGPEKYHLKRFTFLKKMFNLINYSNITLCTATGVNIVINIVFFLIKSSCCIHFSAFGVGHLFPLVTSLNRVGLKLNLKISILQIFFHIYVLVIA